MDMKTLEAHITAKADKNVQAAILVFRREVKEAARKLFEDDYSPDFSKDPWLGALEILTYKRSSKNWPGNLWQKEEAKIRTEIMSTMDTLQQVLLTKEPETPYEDTAEQEESPAQ